MSRKLTVEIPKEVADVSWFRLLHLFGNPVDLCHPAEITHTAVFEHFRWAIKWFNLLRKTVFVEVFRKWLSTVQKTRVQEVIIRS